MHIQKSYESDQGGKLYLVPTPIGNLEDITYRALHTLRTVDMIAAEDTRNTKKLLNYFDITTSLISYHEHNKDERETQLLRFLDEGKSIAIVSDAGMPAISDPGYEIVQAAIAHQYPVIVLPGANAALSALVGSGLKTGEFLFYGFLPRKNKEKDDELQRLKSLRATLIFYESPYRVKDTLHSLRKNLGNRQIVIAREITKLYEEYIRGHMEEVIAWLYENDLKGECCIVVEGDEDGEEEDLWWGHLSVLEHVNHYIKIEKATSKEAIKLVAKERKMPKREVYQIFHVNKDE